MALIQATKTHNLSAPFTSPVASGHFLVAFVSLGFLFPPGAVSITGVSDDVNGAWTAVSDHQWSDASGTFDTMVAEFWYLPAASGAGVTTVTITFSGSGFVTAAMIMAEYSGVALPAVLDAHSETDDAASTSHSGTPIVTSTDCLVLAALSDAGGFADAYTVGAGWTQVERRDGDGADQILLEQQTGPAGTYTPTATTSDSHETGIFAAAFQEPSAGITVHYGVATETDTAGAYTASVAVPYGVATETDTAGSFAPARHVLYGVATETDHARGFLPVGPLPAASASPPSTGIGRGEHRVFLYGRGGAGFVGEVGFTSLTYSRRLDDKSTAQVSIGAGTKTFLGDLRGWKHELLIARDDKEVWLGPIHEPEWEPGAVTLPADDLLGWLDNRDIAEDLTMNDVDLATVFARLVHDSMAREPSPGLYAAASLSGVVGDRSYVAAQHQAVGDALRSLGQAGVDYTCILRRLYIGALSLLPSITLTDDTLRSPKVKEGKAATKVTLVGSTTSNIGQPIEAVAGGPNVEMGLLEKTINDPDVMTHDGAVHYARDAYAFLNPAPLYVTGVLAPTAPVDMEHLIPGMHVAAKLSGTDRKVDAVCRLTQVDVTVRPSEQGQQETITVTLVPVGLEG